jgi:hypothetical protein
LPFRSIPSLADVLPGYQRRLAVLGLTCYTLFAVIAIVEIAFSHLRM